MSRKGKLLVAALRGEEPWCVLCVQEHSQYYAGKRGQGDRVIARLCCTCVYAVKRHTVKWSVDDTIDYIFRLWALKETEFYALRKLVEPKTL